MFAVFGIDRGKKLTIALIQLKKYCCYLQTYGVDGSKKRL